MDRAQNIITKEERSLITGMYRKLLRSCSSFIKKEDVTHIREALNISINQEDAGLKTLSGKPTVIHSLEIALIVVNEIGLGRTSVVCALLYQAVLDKKVTKDEIDNQFGSQASTIVEGLVKVNELYAKNTSIENDNFRKLLLTFAQDVRVVLIIIADKLRDMRELKNYPPEHQKRISGEVGYLYAPMAHRLGLYNIKSELEDLVMKQTHRNIYSEIAGKLSETKVAREKYIKEFIAPLDAELKKTGLKYEIKGRTKTIHSIWHKLKKQKTEFENVFDLFAIRIILDSKPKAEKSECWQVYSLVTDRYQPNPRRLRDWLSVPKSNGYESLHITVKGEDNRWVEVQIRTQQMNEIAEKGMAAHWKYKGVKGEQGMEQWLSNIRDILENPELNAIDFIEDFKLDLYDEEVFVFTPKGDLRRLKKGATVLDFAFDIHSDIGKKCTGAIVNERNVAIKYKLNNGDQVEIITSSIQTPKTDWLNIVATSKAISKLKQALNEIQYKDAEIGKEMLMRRFKNWKYDLDDKTLHRLIKHFNYKTTHDFMLAIASEQVEFSNIKEFVIELNNAQPDGEVEQERSAHKFTKEAEPDSSEVLMIDKNLTGVDYTLAKCCTPVFGDDVFGFVVSSGGIKIHRVNCPNASDMHNKFAYRIIKANWITGTDTKSYSVTLKVTGSDDIGIVTNISQIIQKESNIKMRSISVDSQEGTFEGNVTVFVNSTNSLNALTKKKKVPTATLR